MVCFFFVFTLAAAVLYLTLYKPLSAQFVADDQVSSASIITAQCHTFLHLFTRLKSVPY